MTFVPALYQRVMTSDGWSVRQVRNMIGGPELGQEQEPVPLGPFLLAERYHGSKSPGKIGPDRAARKRG